VELIRIEPTTGIARVIVRFVRNLGIARRARRVRIECATHAVKPAIPRANVIHDAKHAAAQTIETLAKVLHTETEKHKGCLFCLKTPGRTVRHLTSVSSIAAAFFSKQVSKGLAAEVQARPLRK
jgi:hypothetical protein